MAGSVGNDELAAFGRKESIGNINSDALLTFGRQAVDEKCEVKFAALRPDLFRIDLEGCQMVLKNKF
jgi:hypothetical protein